MSFEKTTVSYKICIEMILQRGYKMESTYIAIKPDNKKVIIKQNTNKNLNTQAIREVISSMEMSDDIKHTIIIYQNKITPSTKNIMKLITNMVIEVFNRDELQFNITKHVLQPTYERLDKKEAEIFKEKYGMKYPKMFVHNPISRFYLYKEGDVIKITRKNKTIIYRIVV